MKDRRYVILRKDLRTGEICGYCEHSFCMGFEKDRVQVNGGVLKLGEERAKEWFGYLEKKPSLYSNLVRTAKSPNQKIWLELRENVELLKKKHKDKPYYEFKLFRLGKNCPVEVDFTEANLMIRNKMKYDKYLWRNQPMKVVHPEKW